MADIDPLSQLIGSLSAQITNVESQVIDLRSAVIMNRTENAQRWDALEQKIDLVHAEYRTVKHLERGMEQSSIAIDAAMKGLDKRLRTIEDIVLIWRTRLMTLMSIAVAAGALVGSIIAPAMQAIFRNLIG